MMLQAMNFDYICKHVSVGEWGTGDGETEGRRDGERKNLIFRLSLLLSFSPSLLLSFSIPRSDYILAAAASTARRR
jgi:hypothetical protein